MKNNFVKLVSANLFSKLGNALFDYTNTVFISSIGLHSNVIMAVYKSTETFINLIFNLLGGVLSDKANKKIILVITDLLSGLLCIILSVYFNFDNTVKLVIIINIFLAVVYSFNSPTYKAIIVLAIQKNKIALFNSINNGLSEIIALSSPILGMLIMRLWGIKISLLISGIIFILSSIAIFSVSIKISDRINNKKIYIISDVKDGFIYIFNKKDIFNLIILSAIINFFLAGYNLVLPYSGLFSNSRSEIIYTALLTFEAIGGLIGAILIQFFDIKNRNFIINCCYYMGIFLIAVPIVPIIYINIFAPILICLFSIFLAMFNIALMSYIQLNVSENYIGRVFSVVFSLAMVLNPLGSFFFMYFIFLKWNSFFIFGIGIIIITIFSNFFGKIKKL